MGKRLRLFFDESGNFTEGDVYFGCIGYFGGKNLNLERTIEEIFKSNKIEWRTFHATNSKNKIIQMKEILKGISSF